MKGLGESSSFGRLHPLTTTIYYAITIGLTMFTNSPWFLGISMGAGLLHVLLLKGSKVLKRALVMALVIMTMTSLFNMIFSHNGETVLFYVNHNRITLEALCYGGCISMMIVAVIWWFMGFGEVMTSDKVIYVFGRMAPVLGLTISMVFRFVPILKNRYQEISAGQKALGSARAKGPLQKARQVTKEISILISWSLESSIESADSMSARGYGMRGRTSFHLFRFTGIDAIFLLAACLLGIACAALWMMGYAGAYYYPRLDLGLRDPMQAAALGCFALLLAMPTAADMIGEYRWKRSELKA